jgi:hypothetical protein
MTRRRRRSTPWAEVSGIEPVLPGVSADCLGSKQKQKRVIKQRVSLMEKQRGTTVFPIARIRKIIKADKDLDMMTGEAVFMIAVATVGLHLCNREAHPSLPLRSDMSNNNDPSRA